MEAVIIVQAIDWLQAESTAETAEMKNKRF